MSATSVRYFTLACVLAAAGSTLSAPPSFAAADDITGYWDIFDKNGDLDATLEIYPSQETGVLEGRIVKLHRPQDQGKICTACSGERHNQPVLAMKVITDLQWNPEKNGWYGNGLDPERGWEPRIRLRKETRESNGNKITELKVCAHYKTDIICVEKDTWPQKLPDEEFLSSLPHSLNSSNG